MGYSMSFFALKYLRKYNTCHVASPSRQHIENTLKYNTRLFVDSKTKIVLKIRNVTEHRLTVRVSHFLLAFPHNRKVFNDRIGQILQTFQLDLDRFQLRNLTDLKKINLHPQSIIITTITYNFVRFRLDTVLCNQRNFLTQSSLICETQIRSNVKVQKKKNLRGGTRDMKQISNVS